MQWYRADSARYAHRKMPRLARLLGVHTMHAIGIHDTLCALVTQAERDDGAMDDIEPVDIAEACRWEGDPAELFEALVEVGFVDRDADGRVWLHGYAERSGAAVRERKRDRDRKGKPADPTERKPISNGTSVGASAGVSVGHSNGASNGHSDARTNVRTYERSPQSPPADGSLEPLLEESIDQAKAKKAEQLTLANPEPAGRPLAAFVEAFNAGTVGTSIPKAIAPGARTGARDKRLREAVVQFPEPEAWFWCGKALGASPGHNGRGTTGWVADLPWLLERGNGAKLEQWMARGAEFQARGGKVLPAPVPGERGDERTVRAANAYREEQQKKHEATMAGVTPADTETMKRGLALVRAQLPQFKRPEGQ